VQQAVKGVEHEDITFLRSANNELDRQSSALKRYHQCFPWIDKFDDPIHGSIIYRVLDIYRFYIVDRLYLDRPYIKLILRAILKAPEGSFLIG